MKIHSWWEGKTKNEHIQALITEYLKRLQGFVDFHCEEIKDSKKRGKTLKLNLGQQNLLRKHKNSFKVFLDPQGLQMTSKEFSHWLNGHALRSTKKILFLVGGPEGFSSTFLKNADMRFSLTRMTLTHEWARVLLLEQLYRAFTILRGHPYGR